MSQTETVEIKGVWIIRDAEHLGGVTKVIVELPDGTHKLIQEHPPTSRGDGPISHYTHPLGIVHAPDFDAVGKPE